MTQNKTYKLNLNDMTRNRSRTGRNASVFPWSKIILSFLMVTSFLIFATMGGSEAGHSIQISNHVMEIVAGTTIFSLATILMVWAGRMIPKNF